MQLAGRFGPSFAKQCQLTAMFNLKKTGCPIGGGNEVGLQLFFKRPNFATALAAQRQKQKLLFATYSVAAYARFYWSAITSFT